MKKFLSLALLLGLPKPIFAGDSTSGYKKMYSCSSSFDAGVAVYFMKKENSNSKKWGVYSCSSTFACSWADKAVSYDTAEDKYEKKCCNIDDSYCD